MAKKEKKNYETRGFIFEPSVNTKSFAKGNPFAKGNRPSLSDESQRRLAEMWEKAKAAWEAACALFPVWEHFPAFVKRGEGGVMCPMTKNEKGEEVSEYTRSQYSQNGMHCNEDRVQAVFVIVLKSGVEFELGSEIQDYEDRVIIPDGTFLIVKTPEGVEVRSTLGWMERVRLRKADISTIYVRERFTRTWEDLR